MARKLNFKKNKALKNIDKNVVYHRIGMALVSDQRGEKVCKSLISCLILLDKEINVMSSKKFVEKSPNLKNIL